jgi:hypothetical protein
MGTVLVSTVRFLSTRLNTLSASLAGGPPAAAAGPRTAAGTTSGRGRHLVLMKFAEHTGPTSVHNRYVAVRDSGTHKNYI